MDLATNSLLFQNLALGNNHYAFELFFDLYGLGLWTDADQIQILIDDQIRDTWIKNSQATFQQFCGNTLAFYFTYANMFTHFLPSANIKLKFPSSNENSFGVGSVQILLHLCHYSCSTCSGPLPTDCRTCKGNQILSRKTNSCDCPQNLPFFNQNTCVIQCDINQTSDENNQCVINPLLSSISQILTSNSNDYSKINVSIPTQIAVKNYQSVSLLGNFNQSQILTTALNNQYNQVRIRFNVYDFSNQTNTLVNITSGQVTFQPQPIGIVKYSDSQLSLIDIQIDTNILSSISISVNSSNWAINNIYIDSINCQNNCEKCASNSICQTCQSPFFNQNGVCVSACPEDALLVGGVCKDFTSVTQYSKYLTKAFESNANIVDILTQTAFDHIYTSSIKYGAQYDGKRSFGSFSNTLQSTTLKNYSDLPPHYQIRVYFNRTFIMQVADPTSSSIRSCSDMIGGNLYNLNPQLSSKYNSYTVSHTDSKLLIGLLNFGYLYSVNINYLISNYYVLIDQCQPLCKRCTNATDCQEWIVEQNSNGTICNTGYIFDMNKQKCTLCPIGCASCQYADTCQSCQTNFVMQGTSCYCVNGQIDEETLECINPRARLLSSYLRGTHK